MRLASFLLMVACLETVQAHDFFSTKLTWTRDISRIVYKRCASCHHEGGSAFSLMKYDEARPWAKAIKDEVLNRRMPPWNAVKGFGDLYDDRSLTQEEISVVSNWVEGGAPEGQAIYAPEPPKFSEGMDAGPTAPQKSATVTSALAVKDSVELFGIMPVGIEPNDSVQVIASRPDGSIVPLLWVKQANADYSQIYYYSNDVPLPPGSKISVVPPDHGRFALYWKPAPPPAKPATKRTQSRKRSG